MHFFSNTIKSVLLKNLQNLKINLKIVLSVLVLFACSAEKEDVIDIIPENQSRELLPFGIYG